MCPSGPSVQSVSSLKKSAFENDVLNLVQLKTLEITSDFMRLSFSHFSNEIIFLVEIIFVRMSMLKLGQCLSGSYKLGHFLISATF